MWNAEAEPMGGNTKHVLQELYYIILFEGENKMNVLMDFFRGRNMNHNSGSRLSGSLSGSRICGLDDFIGDSFGSPKLG